MHARLCINFDTGMCDVCNNYVFHFETSNKVHYFFTNLSTQYSLPLFHYIFVHSVEYF